MNPQLLPIDRCPICPGLPSVLYLDYERGAVPLALNPIGDSRLVCPHCGTLYASIRVHYEAESFMDPTEDNETITRLPNSADPKVLQHLASLITGGKTPNWHLNRHALVSVADACLRSADLATIDLTLLHHPDPAIRAETALHLLTLPAKAFLAIHSPIPVLANLLLETPHQTFELDSTGRNYLPGDTHRTAARALRFAAQAGLPFGETAVHRLAALLHSPNPAHRFEAAWALIFLLDECPSYAAQLPTIPPGPVPDMLATRVQRILHGDHS